MPKIGDAVELWTRNAKSPIAGKIVAVHSHDIIVCCDSKRFSAVVGRRSMRRDGAVWTVLARSDKIETKVTT